MALFLRQSVLQITYTVADYPGADVTYSQILSLPGTGKPRRAYHLLKGNAANMNWPQGATVFTFPGVPGFGNQLLTDAFGHKYGIVSWNITASPGNVPGKLTVASYHNGNPNNAAPDATSDYDLGTGAWDSGPLPVHATDGTVLWRAPMIRWVPINLLFLL